MNSFKSSNKWGLIFHHLGLAVKTPEAAERFLSGLGYRIGPMISDSLQNVRARMCEHDQMPDVEIIWPGAGEGPLDTLLLTHKEGLVYHLCYTSPNFKKTMNALENDEELHLFCVSPPTEAVLFDGKRVSFYLVNQLGLIEILDEEKA